MIFFTILSEKPQGEQKRGQRLRLSSDKGFTAKIWKKALKLRLREMFIDGLDLGHLSENRHMSVHITGKTGQKPKFMVR